MKETMDIMNELEDKSPIIRPPGLKLVTGGKGPVDPPGHNYLAELDKGTIFLGKMREHKTFELTQYRLKFKFIKAALIKAYLPERVLEFYVDMKQFSKDVELIEIIGLEEDASDDDLTTNSDE